MSHSRRLRDGEAKNASFFKHAQHMLMRRRNPVCDDLHQSSRGNVMQEYRAYLLGIDGHIRDRIEMESESDEEAIAKARLHFNGGTIEIWQGVLIVAKLNGGSE